MYFMGERVAHNLYPLATTTDMMPPLCVPPFRVFPNIGIAEELFFTRIIEKAKPDLCITHAPGHMLVTDIPSSERIAPITGMTTFQ